MCRIQFDLTILTVNTNGKNVIAILKVFCIDVTRENLNYIKKGNNNQRFYIKNDVAEDLNLQELNGRI